MPSTSVCYLNDRFLPYEEASIHVSDLALHRGYGVFDFMREIEGKVPFMEDYLDRFFRSADGLRLKVPVGRKRIREIIHHLIKENAFRNSGIKIILTGGPTEDFYHPVDPALIVINTPFKGVPKEFDQGVKLLLFEHRRFLPEIKTIDYLPAVWLLPELERQGAIEPLFHFSGKILETSRGNIFFIKDRVIITPDKHILQGISRKYLLKIAREHFSVEEREVRVEEIPEMDEAFITGTSKHVLPVIQIGEEKIGDGKPGYLTLKMMEAFGNCVKNSN